eukprot:1156764-Amphidinium_carterae.1
MDEYRLTEVEHLGRPVYESEAFRLQFDHQSWVLLRRIPINGFEDEECLACVRDDAMSPLDVKHPWHVLDEYTKEFAAEPGLQVSAHRSNEETTFRCRRNFLKAIAEAHDGWERDFFYSLLVNRSQLVESSLSAVLAATPSQLCALRLQAVFQGEYAEDAGGPFREWMDLLGKELAMGHTLHTSPVPHVASDKARHLSEQLSDLWTRSQDSMLLPKPGGEDRLKFFVAVGRLLALSLLHRESLPLPLSLIVYKCILQQKVTAEDIQHLDPDFYSHRLEKLLTPGGADALADMLGEPLAFMSAGTSWRQSEVPLLEDGETKQVTEDNKQEYAALLSEDYLVGGIRHELAAIRNGFLSLLPPDHGQDVLHSAGLTAWDLQRLIEGASHVDVEKLKASSRWTTSREDVKASCDFCRKLCS